MKHASLLRISIGVSLAAHAAVLLLPTGNPPVSAGQIPEIMSMKVSLVSGNRAANTVDSLRHQPSPATNRPVIADDIAKPARENVTPEPRNRIVAKPNTAPAPTKTADVKNGPVAAPEKIHKSGHTNREAANPATATSPARISQASAAVSNQLYARFEYPMVARRRGWQGDVHLGMRIDARGGLSHIRVLKSSGHPVLDRSALRAAERIETVPEAATFSLAGYMDVVVPVHYRLTDS